MSYTPRFTDSSVQTGQISPQSVTDAAVVSGWVLASRATAICAQVFVGAIGAATTADATVTQATDSSGTGAKAITGGAFTQIGATGDNTGQLLNLRPGQLDLANGFKYVKLTITVAGDNAALVFGALWTQANDQKADTWKASEVTIIN